MAVTTWRGRVMPVPPVVRDVGAGVVSGIVAGLLASGVLVVSFMFFSGRGPLYPFQLVGSFIAGDTAMGELNVFGALLGMAILGVVAIGWSTLFGLAANVFEARRGWNLVILCAALAVVAQLVDLHLLTPLWLNNVFGHNVWAAEVPPVVGWAVHLVFGAGLLVFPQVYEVLWGVRPKNWYGRRKYDPIDPLGA